MTRSDYVRALLAADAVRAEGGKPVGIGCNAAFFYNVVLQLRRIALALEWGVQGVEKAARVSQSGYSNTATALQIEDAAEALRHTAGLWFREMARVSALCEQAHGNAGVPVPEAYSRALMARAAELEPSAEERECYGRGER